MAISLVPVPSKLPTATVVPKPNEPVVGLIV